MLFDNAIPFPFFSSPCSSSSSSPCSSSSSSPCSYSASSSSPCCSSSASSSFCSSHPLIRLSSSSSSSSISLPSSVRPSHGPFWPKSVSSTAERSIRPSPRRFWPLPSLTFLSVLLFLLPLFLPSVGCSYFSDGPVTTNASESSASSPPFLEDSPAGVNSSAPLLNANVSLFELLVGPNQWNQSDADSVSLPFLRFRLFTLNWQQIATPFGVSFWLLLASFAKILFNMNKGIAEAVPDSALLIALGLVLGWVLRTMDVDGAVFSLDAHTFFLYLLPPIIFDAGYFMPNRQLFDNFDSVLLFAFVGTVWNTMAIGFSLLWLGHLSLFSVPFSAFQILLFASLISAVDPVAVIAVFEQVHINEFLFINVFGEALFNDGVSVVLYQMFRKFIAIGEPNLEAMDYAAGVASFLVIAVGGVLIGLLFSLITCIATKLTTRVRILAPVFVFIVPYMAYLTAELFGLSSILAIVACGISMKQYVKGNLSHDASNSVKYFVKMLAQCSETVIFMFLGLSAVSEVHLWDWAFIVATIAFCLLYRVIGVVVQCLFLNRFRTKKFSFSDQFVLSYGGLRGAIAFGLVVSLEDSLPPKQMFVTTCISVIFFTVFFQGITIRPLLHWLKVKKNDVDKEETMFEKLCSRNCDYLMAGIEDIVGRKGPNAIRDTFERFNAKVLKPALMRGEQRKAFDASPIIRAYNKLTLLEAQRTVRGSVRRTRKDAPLGHRVGPAPSPSSASASSTLTHYQWMEGRNSAERRTAYEGICAIPSQQKPTDAFYGIFARLFDKNAIELEKTERDDDIKDNYMMYFISKSEEHPANISRRKETNGETDGERRGRSLSPKVESQTRTSKCSVAAHMSIPVDQLRPSNCRM
ncbi:hypothetical protein niasHS_010691 [Heterodera schachtii]|uniref:Sodium/hydrogen exchanger n=1 Tax=Heterodera schachtii TaxID=97005 RepID=A0ABD2ISA9_HETSC